jgi:hypothetical protein
MERDQRITRQSYATFDGIPLNAEKVSKQDNVAASKPSSWPMTQNKNPVAEVQRRGHAMPLHRDHKSQSANQDYESDRSNQACAGELHVNPQLNLRTSAGAQDQAPLPVS